MHLSQRAQQRDRALANMSEAERAEFEAVRAEITKPMSRAELERRAHSAYKSPVANMSEAERADFEAVRAEITKQRSTEPPIVAPPLARMTPAQRWRDYKRWRLRSLRMMALPTRRPRAPRRTTARAPRQRTGVTRLHQARAPDDPAPSDDPPSVVVAPLPPLTPEGVERVAQGFARRILARIGGAR